jgi:hypothetical protein
MNARQDLFGTGDEFESVGLDKFRQGVILGGPGVLEFDRLNEHRNRAQQWIAPTVVEVQMTVRDQVDFTQRDAGRAEGIE